MKDMSLVMKEAHKLTKEIKSEFPEVDYKTQLGICISYLLNKKESDKKVIIVKETAKAKQLKLRFVDILGNDRDLDVWFPNGWLEENNAPKKWALNKKISEVKDIYKDWCLIFMGILVG